MKDAMPRAGAADRYLAMIGYGLLFASVFFVGVTAIVAVAIAYSARSRAPASLRGHFDRQIRIFWGAVALGTLAFVSGTAGAVLLINGGVHWTIEGHLPRELTALGDGHWILALLGGSLLLWVLAGLWLLIAPAIGFIRLATADAEA